MPDRSIASEARTYLQLILLDETRPNYKNGKPPTPLRRSVLPAGSPEPEPDPRTTADHDSIDPNPTSDDNNMSEIITITTTTSKGQQLPTVSILAASAPPVSSAPHPISNSSSSTVNSNPATSATIPQICDKTNGLGDDSPISNNTTLQCLGDSSTTTITSEDCIEVDASLTDGDNDQTLTAIGSAGSEDLTSVCDTSLDSGTTRSLPPKPFPRSILNTSNSSADSSLGCNGNAVTRNTHPRQHAKKSVSFETDDEKIRKFINGEVIVDQRNPFKSAIALKREEFFAQTSPKRKPIQVIPTTPISLTTDDFISTEDVLKESKFVKTYVKNPDKYFERDPKVLEKLRKELEAEQRKVLPVRKSKLSRFNPASIYAKAQVKLNGTDQVDRGYLSRNKSIDRSRYPELSDIKVKVGTDLEESLYNPDEVTLNAKRFDDRIKNSLFGSQDDLEDIADLTSNSAGGESERTGTSDEEPPEPKSFTNTVNSQEFQEYLMKKGLSLTPKKDVEKNGPSSHVTGQPNNNQLIEMAEAKADSAEREKKPKKPSVLQRLFPGRHIFSSKRRTTPKDPSPEPKPLYATLSDEEVNNKPSDIKRVVLERKSFHAGQMSHAELSRHLRGGVERTRKTFMDDGSSSISSALTNAENYVDMGQPTSTPAVPSDEQQQQQQQQQQQLKQRTPENKENYLEMKASWPEVAASDADSSLRRDAAVESAEQPRLRSSLVRPKTQSGLTVPVASSSETSSIPLPQKHRKDQLVQFENTTPDVRDGTVIKPRVQRVPAVVQVNTSKPLDRPFGQPPPKALKPPVPLRRTGERQSMIYKKPTTEDSVASSPMSRAVSMDKAEIKRRSIQKPLIRAKPINLQNIPHLMPVKPIVFTDRTTTTNTNDNQPPNVASAQLITSTPIANTIAQPNFYFHKKPSAPSPATPTTSSISPISPLPKRIEALSPTKKLQLDPYSWAKLRELKEQTDRQLYSKQPPEMPKNIRDHIYGRTEEPPPPQQQSTTASQPENIYEKLPRHRDRNSIAGKVETNQRPADRPVQQPQLSPQEQYHQQMLQLQHQYQQQQLEHQQKFFEELKRQKELQEQQQMQQLRQQQQQQLQQQRLQQANANFVRNSPQRNTIGDVYRNRDLKLVDGKCVDAFGRVHVRALDPVSESEQTFRPLSQASNGAPVRCQSVLGNMSNGNGGQYATLAVPNTNNVVMRPKAAGKLSREEIMSRVTEFCRKSMNKTPTKYLQGSTSAEVSPTSYATISSGRSSGGSAKPAPQVPQRVQSLASSSVPDSPIYAPIIKRGSIQSTASELYDSPVQRAQLSHGLQLASRQPSYSETDSVFMPSPNSHPATPNAATTYYLLNNHGQPIAYHPIPKSLSGSSDPYASRQSVDAYGRLYSQEPLYDSLPPPQPAAGTPQRTSQIYYPINGTLRRNQMQLNAASGRATPLILQAIPQQPIYGQTTMAMSPAQMAAAGASKLPQRVVAAGAGAAPVGRTGTIVVLDNVEQMYRPIVPTIKVLPTARPPSRQPLALHRSYVKSGKCVVPYESESCSEAEEVQRILQTDNQGRRFYA